MTAGTMRFRQHKGDLAESVATTVELLATMQALTEHVATFGTLDGGPPSNLTVDLLTDRRDDRIGWDRTYLIKAPGWGILGMTDKEPM